MAISDDLNNLFDRQMEIVDRIATDMLSEIIKKTPKREGTLRKAWQMEKITGGWRLSNNMEYADVIFDGRRLVAGKWYGSEQMPEGIDPILNKYNIMLEVEINRLKA